MHSPRQRPLEGRPVDAIGLTLTLMCATTVRFPARPYALKPNNPRDRMIPATAGGTILSHVASPD